MKNFLQQTFAVCHHEFLYDESMLDFLIADKETLEKEFGCPLSELIVIIAEVDEDEAWELEDLGLNNDLANEDNEIERDTTLGICLDSMWKISLPEPLTFGIWQQNASPGVLTIRRSELVHLKHKLCQ